MNGDALNKDALKGGVIWPRRPTAFPTRCTRLVTQAKAQTRHQKNGWLKQAPAFAASVQLLTEYSRRSSRPYQHPFAMLFHPKESASYASCCFLRRVAKQRALICLKRHYEASVASCTLARRAGACLSPFFWRVSA